MFNLEVIGLFILGCLAWFWFDSLKTREAGVRAVRAACESEGLQLLDETIAIVGIQPVRNPHGRIVLSRTYTFEYSDSGDNRRLGRLHLMGTQVEILNLGSRLPTLPDRSIH
jgi:hypothetical protein